MIWIFLIAVAFVVGFFVGRNNPSLKVVQKLVNAGKVISTVAGDVAKAVK